MPTFNCAGVHIETDLDLRAPLSDQPPDYVVREGPQRPVPFERPSAELIAERTADGVAWYSFAATGSSVTARFYGLVDFEITDSGDIWFSKDPAADTGLVAILVTGTILAYLLSASGHLVLHASSVEVGGAALAFIGESGQGKTTVATLMCADGYPLVTDDVLPVSAEPSRPWIVCRPAGIELRVRPKSASLVERFSGAERGRITADERHTVAPPRTACGELRLAALVIPRPNRELTVVQPRRLPTAEATLALARWQRIEGWTSPVLLRRQFELCAEVAGRVPVTELQIPWGPPFAETLAADIAAAVGLER